MYRLNFRKTLIFFCLTALFNVFYFSSSSGLVEAKESSDTSTQGLPGRRVGGGTRGGCAARDKQLTALIPDNYLGTTVAAHPTLFFYLPQITAAQTVEFIIRDQNDHTVYETTFVTSGDSGIISLSLPDSATMQPLQVNKNYHWYFSIVCNPLNRAEDIVVEGWIRRIEMEPALANQLAHASPLDQVKLYLEAGIWHEALISLTELQRSQSENAAVLSAWSEALQLVGLDKLAQEMWVRSYVAAESGTKTGN
ncbi:MAG: DUF928 domain-containing protein [Cyanothece sp. SIO1E1]|nr:DUF928 domain-containing protein [Cyanothece sp. SIO1E1]